jgi:hypothetical protein
MIRWILVVWFLMHAVNCLVFGLEVMFNPTPRARQEPTVRYALIGFFFGVSYVITRIAVWRFERDKQPV